MIILIVITHAQCACDRFAHFESAMLRITALVALLALAAAFTGLAAPLFKPPTCRENLSFSGMRAFSAPNGPASPSSVRTATLKPPSVHRISSPTPQPIKVVSTVPMPPFSAS